MDDKSAKQEDGQNRKGIKRLNSLIKDCAITDQALNATIADAFKKLEDCMNDQ